MGYAPVGPRRPCAAMNTSGAWAARGRCPDKESIMTTATPERVATTVPLDWNEVWFTNCPMVSANNVDQELGWCREEYKKIGVEYAYFRHAPENNWYPHYIHNLDNLIRFGGLYPPDPRPRRHPPDRAARGDLGARRWLHGGPGRRPDLPDGAPAGQEDRHQQEPEHHQERLVADPGAHGHREHADAPRHDDGRHRARGVPVCGRLVRQARDARAAHEQPVRAVDAPRPQARPRLPATGEGVAGRDRGCHLHPEQGLPAPPGGDRPDRHRSRTCRGTRTGGSRSRTRLPSSPAPT